MLGLLLLLLLTGVVGMDGYVQVSLPGTFKAADRFVRLSFLVDALPKNGTYKDMVATQLSVIR